MLNNYPSELDMLEAFGVSVYKSIPKEGFWSYKFERNSIILIFSFNTAENFVKTELLFEGKVIEEAIHEGVSNIEVIRKKKMIKASFVTNHVSAYLIIQVENDISVKWNTLINFHSLGI